MRKRMFAKYKGTDARTGAPIRPGDEIIFDTDTRQAWITDEDDYRHAEPEPDETYLARARGAYVSHVWSTGGREYYRNKAGRCEDAPCCGCCNI
jgi:hypothetical protein